MDHLKDKGVSKVPFDKLNQALSNIGRTQFSYEVFKNAYDFDDRIQEIVSDFDDDSVTLKQSETDDLDIDKDDKSGDSVEKMAKRATKIGK